ncbi:MAG: hypothetical protein MZV70_49545 [Desulfobacterales bacterium]|nr:hypothetical protein [Desulfobacterales bacterium]
MELDLNRLRPEPEQPIDIEAPAALIAGTQRPSGEIPWCDGAEDRPLGPRGVRHGAGRRRLSAGGPQGL